MNKFLVLSYILLSFKISNAQQELIKIEGYAQGTTYHITYLDAKGRDLQFKIDSILNDFDKSVSTYLPSSIISQINSNQPNVIVDNYFIACFNKAKQIYKDTKGAFDPTVFPLINAWGFGPNKKEKLSKQTIDSIVKFVGFNKIKLKGNRIIKKDPRVSLDFNAFAQGYSVDVIAQFLNSKNIISYIVEIGGEVYAQGKDNEDKNWLIGIEKPIDNKEGDNPLKAIVKLDGMAIATSGNYRKYIVINGVKYAHHINPKTGYPTQNNLLSASVFSKECITSDATATGILVMGLEKAKKYLNKHPEIQAYIIYSDENGKFKVYETPLLKDLLVEVNE